MIKRHKVPYPLLLPNSTALLLPKLEHTEQIFFFQNIDCSITINQIYSSSILLILEQIKRPNSFLDRSCCGSGTQTSGFSTHFYWVHAWLQILFLLEKRGLNLKFETNCEIRFDRISCQANSAAFPTGIPARLEWNLPQLRLEVPPSQERCAMLKSQGLLCSFYVVYIIIFQPFLLQHNQKLIKLHNYG